ncbi:hypothetical protein [Sphingomonas lacusdianchii]|uniref:hypothetical protein n=1 Tax=Sphingomonas lacusdianchii TaxID=2917992 RepID=UPI001F597106|nr:hypothetical protein [Sphingomonas sp. JXJ CY 53]
MPVSTIAATIAVPKPAKSASAPAVCGDRRTARVTNTASAPIHAPAASRWTMSAIRCNRPATPSSIAPWPFHASVALATAASSATGVKRGCGTSNATSIASNAALRTRKAVPGVVSRTSISSRSRSTDPTPAPVIAAASSTKATVDSSSAATVATISARRATSCRRANHASPNVAGNTASNRPRTTMSGPSPKVSRP